MEPHDPSILQVAAQRWVYLKSLSEDESDRYNITELPTDTRLTLPLLIDLDNRRLMQISSADLNTRNGGRRDLKHMSSQDHCISNIVVDLFPLSLARLHLMRCDEAFLSHGGRS